MDDLDKSDVSACLAGDARAYASIIRRHQVAVTQRMRRFARSLPEAQDLAHEVFVKAYFSLRSYRGTAPLENWLNSIGTRVGYRHWKTRSKSQSIDSDQLQHLAGRQENSGTEAAELLQVLLDQLPPRDRLVITLLYLEEQSVEQAARQTGWSKTLVKVQAHRARAKLKKAMKKLGLDDENRRGVLP